MKQKMILMAAFCVLLSAIAAFAQTKTDFSGNWTLDVSKSKVNNIESGTMKVTQTDKEFSYTNDFKRTPRPEAAAGGNGGGAGQGGGMGRGAGMGQGAPAQPLVYSLDGKETSSEMTNPQGMTIKSSFKTEWEGGKLKLTTKRAVNTPNGVMNRNSKETWEILEGGKALKRTIEAETPNGPQITEFYFTKN